MTATDQLYLNGYGKNRSLTTGKIPTSNHTCRLIFDPICLLKYNEWNGLDMIVETSQKIDFFNPETGHC